MSLLDRIAKVLHIASGRKMVTFIGLIVSSLSAACLTLGDDWLSSHVSEWMPRICGAFIFIGAIITAFGKGLADRRVDPEVQGIVEKERREPVIDG